MPLPVIATPGLRQEDQEPFPHDDAQALSIAARNRTEPAARALLRARQPACATSGAATPFSRTGAPPTLMVSPLAIAEGAAKSQHT